MLEVCVDSIESALAAVEGGAGRIELCAALSEGGLTPSPGILKILKHDLNIKIPIFSMLRPRRGNDFHYSDAEMQALLYDIQLLRDAGTDGFVFGSLEKHKPNVNIDQCKTILGAVHNLPVTFHRAFDLTQSKKMHQTCDLIKLLGFKRILTSGFQQAAEDGLAALRELIAKHTDMCIMPGSGINPNNLERILAETGCREFHASARVRKNSLRGLSSAISMGGSKDDAEPLYVTSVEIVKELVHRSVIADTTRIMCKRSETRRSSAEPNITLQDDLP